MAEYDLYKSLEATRMETNFEKTIFTPLSASSSAATVNTSV